MQFKRNLSFGRFQVHPRSAWWKHAVALSVGAALLVHVGEAAAAEPAGKKDKKTDEKTLKGGAEGTAFESMVIEGEDRVQVEFARPGLDLHLDYRGAMTFDFGDAHEVVEREAPDVERPFLDLSAAERTPYLARPYLQELADGPVARFQPQLENVQSWTLHIADSRSETVRVFEGKGKPPAEIAWDGVADDGSLALPGLTYSYSLEAFDKAGNKRTFVGEGFQVPSYRMGENGYERMLINGADLQMQQAQTMASAPAVVLDAASWVNQASLQQGIQVVAVARTYEQADALGNFVVRHLRQHVVGPRSRWIVQTDVQPMAPEFGAVALMCTDQHGAEGQDQP